jgi:hypothetical protein
MGGGFQWENIEIPPKTSKSMFFGKKKSMAHDLAYPEPLSGVG